MANKKLEERMQEQAKKGRQDSEEALDDLLTKRGLASNVRQSKTAAAPAKKPEHLDTYTVKKGDTLSHIALEYYGSAAREKWMAIYEANKDVIGDNPSLIKPGQELKIPEIKE